MRGSIRIAGIIAVFIVTSIAWLTLSAVTSTRKGQSDNLRGNVQALWGSPQTQFAPKLVLHRPQPQSVERVELRDGKEIKVTETVLADAQEVVPLAESSLDVHIDSDLRRKGLAWYSLYNVGLSADYAYVHGNTEPADLEVIFTLPDPSAIYDDFVFRVDGVDQLQGFDAAGGAVRARVNVKPGQRVRMEAGYKSRGLDQWVYRPSETVSRIERLNLAMHTNFTDIDFPAGTLSPSTRAEKAGGAELTWNFTQVVTGNGIGMITPSRIQPGELASALSLSAPISLFLFFFVLFVLSTLRKIELHSINYALIAGAFFAFHLLFAYSADHLPVEQAFALCSVVSVFLVVSYLRLVVSPRFAFVEAGLAQLVYLVGFSLAHFWEGYTGLTTTVLSIFTLFLLMQLTGRIRWENALRAEPASAP
jgi:inner membrane protein involved in colicin E2 resistance